MTLRIDNSSRRAAAVLCSAIIAAVIAIAAIPLWRANSFALERTQAGWMRAAQIEPGYGEYWYNLAIVHRTDFEHSNPRQAIVELNRAIADDPRSADYWAELGDAYEEQGDLPQARDAYDHALKNYPSSGDVHWRYGNFLLRQGETAQAYAELHEALITDPKITELAISRIWRATGDAHGLLDRVLPNTDASLRPALKFFCDSLEPDAAMAAWSQIASAGRPQPLKLSFPLVDLLLSRGRSLDAHRVWTQALRLAGAPEPKPDASLVFDGGFEAEPVNGGLDWHLDPIPGAAYELDSGTFHGGRQSLHITFEGTQNVDFQNVKQVIPVTPSTRYEFSGWIKTAAISTDSGIRFVIESDSRSMPKLMLENLVGGHDWTNESAEIATPADAHFLVVVVRRVPSHKFENQISGSAWIDDVSLVSAAGSSSSHR